VRNLLLIAVLLAIAAGVFLVKRVDNHEAFREDLRQITINGMKLSVIVADSESERQRGLSNREDLGGADGMLFVFDTKNVQPPFWMKDMEFAIDILWIDDGKVVQMDENAQPQKEGEPLRFYVPKQPVDYVLEVPAGFIDENNITVGTPLTL